MRACKKVKVVISTVFLFLSADCCFGAFQDKIDSAEEAYLGGIYSAVIASEYSIVKNPAALGFKMSARAYMNKSELFGMSELANNSAGLILPLSADCAAGFDYTTFGWSKYREQSAKIMLGLKIDDKSAVGFTAKNNFISIENYGSDSFFSLDAGYAAKVLENFSLGFCARDIISQSFSEDGEKPERSVRGGCGLRYADFMDSYFEAQLTSSRQKIIYRLGQSVGIGGALVVGLGWVNSPQRFSAGATINFKGFKLGYGCITHKLLGYEHHFSLTMIFDNE